MGWNFLARFSKAKPSDTELKSVPRPVTPEPIGNTMSLFTSIFADVKNALHSTMAYIEKVLLEVEGEAPAIANVIDTGLTYITPCLQIALSATGDPAAAAIVGSVAAQARKDLAVASALVTDFGPTPTAASIFASVQTNLNGLLTASHVTSEKSVAAVTKAVKEVGVLGAAVQKAADAIGAAVVPTKTVSLA